MPKVKLTVRSVEAAQPGAVDIILWDSELAGFGCKITPKGRRTYFLYYRTREGQQRRPAIGVHGPWRPEGARDQARRWLADVAQGRDPSQSRTDARAAPTVRELCDRYITEHADTRKKASSVRNDKRLIQSHVIPALGSKKVAAVTRSDISALHHKLRSTPYEANRMLAMTRKMFSLSERWGLRADGTNPARNIDAYPEQKRERFLTADEVARLWTVLESPAASVAVSRSAIAAVKLLMVTGRRLNEVLTLEWAWIDLERRTLALPDTKTGALLVTLNDAAIGVLVELKAAKLDPVYVIAGQRRGRPLVNLQKPWRTLRTLAGLSDVRIHDLRHTFASVGASLGMSLPMIGRLLGHTQAATTARYAHLHLQPVSAAADAIGANIMAMIAGLGGTAKVPVET